MKYKIFKIYFLNKKLVLCLFVLYYFLFFFSFCFSQDLNQNKSLTYARIVYPIDWITLSSKTTKNNIQKIIKETAENNFNTIIFIVNRHGFVVYKSSYVEISELFGQKPLKEDFLSFAIEETKKHNLKFFVAMDLFKTNANTKKLWLCKKEDGSYYVPYFLSCGNPEVQVYTRNIVKEFLSLYQIDGIIFENLYYPSKDTSYDEVSLERFYTRGNPQVLEYEDFQREQLNKFICDLYSEIKQINKEIQVGVVLDAIYKDSFTLEGSFYKNFQDTKKWIENNFCDFVILKSDLNIQLNNFLKILTQNKVVFGIKDKIQQQDFDNLLSRNSLGIVLFSTTTYKTEGSFVVPKIDFKTNILKGQVLDDKNSSISDCWINLVYPSGKIFQTISSYDGVFSFVNITTSPVSLEINYPYCEKIIISSITITENEIKILEPIVVSSASIEKTKLFLNILNPKNLSSQKNIVHIIGRTLPKNKISVFSETISTETKSFETGIFLVDNVKLKAGENKFQFIIKDNLNKNETTHFITITYTTETSKERIIQQEKKEFELILPQENLMLFTEDILELKIKAEKNKKFYALCFDNQEKVFLDEIEDGVYYKRYLIPVNFSSEKTKLKFCYDYEEQKKYFWQKKKIKTKIFQTDVFVEVWNSAYPLIVETTSQKTPLTYGLHYVRLGGPYITELPKGTKLQVVSKQQDKFKVKLSQSLSGWVEEKNLNLIKNKENKILQNYFTTCSVLVGDTSDQIVIPWKEQTAFSISSIIEDNKTYLIVDFFNTHLATTWIINNPFSKVIKDIKLTQLEDGWVQMKILLKQKQLWGWWSNTTSSNLTIYLKHPPQINPENPLKNLKIALEAGHGGEGNSGALGLAGTKEKNLNLRFVEILKSAFEKQGSKIILLRQGDTNPSFDERLKIAYDNSTSLIISIHTNAANTDNGFLNSSSGPSVFYKHDNCKIFAEVVYQELVNLWNKGVGLVGNFNYAIIRQTRIPAILIEMGHLTHPQDEATLLDKDFLKKQANKIVESTKKFLINIK